MTGDSPYRRPERPAQLVTDEKVTAHIDQIIWIEIQRRLRARRRLRLLRGLRTAAILIGPWLAAVILIQLWHHDHEALVLWILFLGGTSLFTWGLLHLIAKIPPR